MTPLTTADDTHGSFELVLASCCFWSIRFCDQTPLVIFEADLWAHIGNGVCTWCAAAKRGDGNRFCELAAPTCGQTQGPLWTLYRDYMTGKYVAVRCRCLAVCAAFAAAYGVLQILTEGCMLLPAIEVQAAL